MVKAPLILLGLLAAFTLQPAQAALPPPVSGEVIRPGTVGESPQDAAALFRASLSRQIGAMKELGIRELGCRKSGLRISLAKLETAAEHLKISVAPTFEKSAWATRWSAFYDPSRLHVYLNGTPPGDNRSGLALHEALGAAGYADLDYQAVSLVEMAKAASLWARGPQKSAAPAVARVRALAAHALCHRGDFYEEAPWAGWLEASNAKLRVARRSGGGGVDVVGGGGDYEALALKQFIAALFLGEPGGQSTAGIWAAAQLRLEFYGRADDCTFANGNHEAIFNHVAHAVLIPRAAFTPACGHGAENLEFRRGILRQLLDFVSEEAKAGRVPAGV